MRTYRIGQVARLAGVTVKTLHHYSKLGLVRPDQRGSGSYREYSDADLERLHRVLGYRELGFSLTEIAALLESPQDQIEHLRRQRHLLLGQVKRLQRVAELVQKTLEAKIMKISLTPEEMFEVFGDSDPTQHAEEAEQRWGESSAYQTSQQRSKSYDKQTWLTIQIETASIEREWAQAMLSGQTPESEQAMAAAEAHRQHLNRWFYECSKPMHRGLGEMFRGDPRFGEHYDKLYPGLGEYVVASILANSAVA